MPSLHNNQQRHDDMLAAASVLSRPDEGSGAASGRCGSDAPEPADESPEIPPVSLQATRIVGAQNQAACAVLAWRWHDMMGKTAQQNGLLQGVTPPHTSSS